MNVQCTWRLKNTRVSTATLKGKKRKYGKCSEIKILSSPR